MNDFFKKEREVTTMDHHDWNVPIDLIKHCPGPGLLRLFKTEEKVMHTLAAHCPVDDISPHRGVFFGWFHEFIPGPRFEELGKKLAVVRRGHRVVFPSDTDCVLLVRLEGENSEV